MTSNIANQFAAILGGIGSVIDGIFGTGSASSAKETMQRTIAKGISKAGEVNTSKAGYPYFKATGGKYKGNK